MNNYQAVIFDLDGTLIDSLLDIADAMNYTLQQFGFPVHDYEKYKYFVGNGLMNLVMTSIPESARNEKMIEACFEVLKDKYRKNYIDKTHLYPGISNLLDELNIKGIKLSVLSNKADEMTQKICKALLCNWKFEVILGASERFPRKPYPESAQYIANQLNILPENILYVGDTNVDMKTANAAGMYPVGVSWGFRTQKELEENGAKLIIDHPMDLIQILNN